MGRLTLLWTLLKLYSVSLSRFCKSIWLHILGGRIRPNVVRTVQIADHSGQSYKALYDRNLQL